MDELRPNDGACIEIPAESEKGSEPELRGESESSELELRDGSSRPDGGGGGRRGAMGGIGKFMTGGDNTCVKNAEK